MLRLKGMVRRLGYLLQAYYQAPLILGKLILEMLLQQVDRLSRYAADQVVLRQAACFDEIRWKNYLYGPGEF